MKHTALTVADLERDITADIDEETRGIQVHKAIAVVVQRWKGKKLNKRFADQVKEELCKIFTAKEWSSVVYYPPEQRFSCGRLCLYHWPFTDPKKGSDHYWVVYLGYGEEVGNYQPEYFEKHDACRGSAAIERNKKRADLLSNRARLCQIAETINTLRDAWVRTHLIEETITSLFYLNKYHGLTTDNHVPDVYNRKGD